MGDTKQAHQDKLEIAQNKEIQKLGWLSSYTRQVLLSRHALRTFYIFTDQMMRFSDDPIWRNSHNTAADTLRLLRALLETLSGTNKTTLRISAPYEPINRPTMFFLGERRSGRMIAVSTERTNSLLGQTIGTSFSTNGLSTGSSASWIGQSGKEPAMGILALETAKVGKGVGLSNKILADQRCEELVHSRLWPLEQGRVWQASELFAPFNSEHKGAFKFWEEWYQGFLDGNPLDWELQRRVALIPDEDWEKGPEHIARKIEEIKAEYLAEKLPLAEDLAFDQNTGTFHTVPREMAKPDLLGATISQVEDALEDVMENGSNGINERSTEYKKLTRTFRKYGNDPQRIEMDFTTVHAGLTRQIISGELPPSEENLALQSALEEGAKAVRATHPEVAENRRILQEQSLRELTPDDKATLEEALPILQAISDEALAEEWAQDIPALTNDSLLPVPDTAPRLPGADEATRIFGRTSKMAIMMLKYPEIVESIHNSTAYKSVKLIKDGATVVGWVTIIVGLGLRVLGII
ncbi:hypothetical protein [Aliiroseovarius crassostreae]|uniref:hypothetical protein n=1 Tax=Aliiroseovarius crassostreae TaxID=154981 RepID=UPI0022048E51|nr:hypothetical protein [Aliiroseovarius crassostreae]UWQ07346.1 hypothetical protein K3X25_11280 [Aliiroseovarius crassostreae]